MSKSTDSLSSQIIIASAGTTPRPSRAMLLIDRFRYKKSKNTFTSTKPQ